MTAAEARPNARERSRIETGRRLIEAGAIRPEIDFTIVVRAKTGLLTHAIGNWIRRPQLANREGLVPTLCAMRRLGTDIRAPGASE